MSLITLFLSYNKISVFRKAMFNNLQSLEFINIEHNCLKFVQRGMLNILSSVRFIHSPETVVCCLTATFELKCSVDNNEIVPGNDCIIYSSRYLRIQWDVLAVVGIFCCIFVVLYHAFLITATTTFFILKITSYGLVVSGSLFTIMRDVCLILKTLFSSRRHRR